MNILKKIIYLFLFSIGIGFFITGCKEKKQSQAAFNPELAKLMRTADSLLKQADSSFYRKQEISSTAQKSKFDKEIRSYLDKVIQMAPTYEGGYIQKTAYLNRCHLYEETLQTLRNMHAHIGTSMNAQMISMKAELEDWIGDSTTAQQDFELANNVLEQQMQYLSENSTTRTLYRLQQVLNRSLKENNFSSIKQELDSLSSSILLPQNIEVSKRFHNNKDFYEYYFNKSCFSEAPYGGNELTESIHKKEASMQITTTINKETTNPQLAYEFAKWMSFGKDGFAKRMELYAKPENGGFMNTLPLTTDSETINEYFDLFGEGSGMDGLSDAFTYIETGGMVEGTKVVPGYLSARQTKKTGLTVPGPEGNIDNCNMFDLLNQCVTGSANITEYTSGEINIDDLADATYTDWWDKNGANYTD